MRTAEGLFQWIDTIVAAIEQSGCEYFRVHDSGDMFSSRYAEAWLEVCIRLPHIRFWIPTRCWQQPTGPLPILDPLMNALRKLAALPNVALRPSALNFGDHAPDITGLHAGSTAQMPDVFRAYQCPAHHQGNQCGTCRACWDAKDMPISYGRH
jgi:hypothetical protein